MEAMQLPAIIAIISFAILGFMVSLIGLKQANLLKLVPLFSYLALTSSVALLVIRGLLTESIPLSNGAEFAMWIVFIVLLIFTIMAKKI